MFLSKPVNAAVEGYAVAGGFELALWCDLRVAAANAVFGVFNRRWGAPLADGGAIRLPRLIGQAHALDLIPTGRGVSGDEARLMGTRSASRRREQRATWRSRWPGASRSSRRVKRKPARRASSRARAAMGKRWRSERSARGHKKVAARCVCTCARPLFTYSAITSPPPHIPLY
jgi:enoyl-CoA hydratase/carnithine racemase